MPPSWSNVVKNPMITDDIASVMRMRYSTDSFSAGSATSAPTTNATREPKRTAATMFQCRLCRR